jgi:aspartyl-tRNA(Asn)/glutamyl-tRNA(Gln) amidotransferase subunit B
LRPEGSSTLGTKVEIKNMNSLRNIQRAIEHEIIRQSKLLNEGLEIIQETRTFDAHLGITNSMRVKESMNDYRYFPEPDLSPLEITEDWLAEIKAKMPLLPWEQEKKLMEQYQLPAYDAHFLSESREMAMYFQSVYEHAAHAKQISNWLMGPVKSYLNEHNLSIDQFALSPEILAEVINLVENGVVSHNLAVQQLLPLCIENPIKSPTAIVAEQKWSKEQSVDELQEWVNLAIAAYPEKVKEYKQGKKGLLALFIGEVMKRSKGTADPKKVNQLVTEALSH